MQFNSTRKKRSTKEEYRARLDAILELSQTTFDELPIECVFWREDQPDAHQQILWDKEHIGVHRLSFNLFNKTTLPPDINVCHSCDRGGCYNPRHLFSGSQGDNIRDAIRKGRFNQAIPPIRYGSQNGCAKLTEEQVRDIRENAKRLRLYGRHAILGRQFGVSATMIRNIVLRKKWKHV